MTTECSLPLVSVVVVTYNSARFVRETLDSVLAQTYQGPIELIVSDDGSQDDTAAICRRWIADNGSRFSSAKFISTPRNLGICGNYNFALSHVTGEWVKYIAGDDILLPGCIDIFVTAASASTDKYWISGTHCFNESEDLGPRFLMDTYLDSEDVAQQLRQLVERGKPMVEGPTLFIHTDTLRSLGGMDMKYPMLEDFPSACLFASHGYHIGVIKQALVKYRVYPESVSQNNPRFFKMYDQAKWDYRCQYAVSRREWFKAWHAYVMSYISDPKPMTLRKRIISTLLKISDAPVGLFIRAHESSRR